MEDLKPSTNISIKEPNFRSYTTIVIKRTPLGTLYIRETIYVSYVSSS